jgi:uncharacterized membrane protein YeaQ/YmgE (transglycosylase-associated protein family)
LAALSVDSPRRGQIVWIVALIVGGIVGWLASVVVKTNAQMGSIADLVIGGAGSMPGFRLAGLPGVVPSIGLLRLAASVAGAALLIFMLGKSGLFRKGCAAARVARAGAGAAAAVQCLRALSGRVDSGPQHLERDEVMAVHAACVDTAAIEWRVTCDLSAHRAAQRS